jgi:hypothetical protein
MSTLGNLRSKIANEMKRTELHASATAVTTAIVEAIEYYAGNRFIWNEFDGGLKTLVASSTAVTMSIAGIGRIRDLDSVKANISSRDYPLTKRSWVELDHADSGQFHGYPQDYAIHGTSLRVYPPPNDNYILRIAGLKSLDEISIGATAGASNAWTDPSQGEQLIKLKAKSNLWRDHVRNPSQAREFAAHAADQFKQIRRTTNAFKGSGRTRQSTF